jgi:hypothetical protein
MTALRHFTTVSGIDVYVATPGLSIPLHRRKSNRCWTRLLTHQDLDFVVKLRLFANTGIQRTQTLNPLYSNLQAKVTAMTPESEKLQTGAGGCR